MVLRTISVKINTFLLKKWQNSRWSREDLIQKTLYQTETQIFEFHRFLKNFAGIDFCEYPILKNFV